MRIVKTAVALAALTVAFDQALGLVSQQWLWERGLTGGIYGLCLMVVVTGSFVISHSYSR